MLTLLCIRLYPVTLLHTSQRIHTQTQSYRCFSQSSVEGQTAASLKSPISPVSPQTWSNGHERSVSAASTLDLKWEIGGSSSEELSGRNNSPIEATGGVVQRPTQRQHRPVAMSPITMAPSAPAHQHYRGHQLASARTDKGPPTTRAQAWHTSFVTANTPLL